MKFARLTLDLTLADLDLLVRALDHVDMTTTELERYPLLRSTFQSKARDMRSAERMRAKFDKH